MTTATITHINGVSREAVDLIESVKSPMAVWRAAHSDDGIQPRAYMIRAAGITSPAIYGSGTTEVGRVTFLADGSPVPSDRLERLDSDRHERGVPIGWRAMTQDWIVLDLLRALVGDSS